MPNPFVKIFVIIVTREDGRTFVWNNNFFEDENSAHLTITKLSPCGMFGDLLTYHVEPLFKN